MPDCSNCSDRETDLSYFHLPLKKKLLQRWIHVIRRKNLPLNKNTTVCSEHFVNATGRILRPDEVPSKKLPVLNGLNTAKKSTRKPPRQRPFVEHHPKTSVADSGLQVCRAFSTELTQTEGPSIAELETLQQEARDREAKLIGVQDCLNKSLQIDLTSVSRILITWINFLYLKLQEIPLWPP